MAPAGRGRSGILALAVLLTAGGWDLGHAGEPVLPALGPVVAYYNGSCHDCLPYLDLELAPLLRSLGAGQIERRD